MAMVVVAGDVCWGLFREEEMVAAAWRNELGLLWLVRCL
jgi:hypothetical protein